MNDQTSERERRINEMMRRQNKDNELGILSQGQAEIQGIQSELSNDLAMQQVQDQSRLQTTGIMAQAAEGMLEMDQGGQSVLAQQVGGMNQNTQALLQKYGVKPQNSQTRNSNSSRMSSGAGTTNVRNEYVTNNRTEIKITQPQIPMSNPQIPVRQQAQSDNTAKFRTWLSGMFAKQQNETEIQRKEYRKKEWGLARNTTRLMRRIESAASGMTQRLDPQRVTSTLGGQLKWLLLLFGATMITKVWKPTMEFLANLEGGFRLAFGLPMNENLRQHSSKGASIVENIKAFIGIKPGEKTTLIEGFGKVITQGVQKLIDRIDFWFEDRSIALREIKMPDINLPKIDIPGFGGLLEGMSDTFKGVGQYIGDIITVALGGSKGRVQASVNHIRSNSVDTYKSLSGRRDGGDNLLEKGSGRSYMRDSDFTMGGVLKGNASSTHAMSRSVSSLMNDSTNTSHAAEIASGVQQIFDVANRQGQVVVDPGFLRSIGLSANDVNQLKAQKGLVPVQYKIIQVRPTDEDLKDMGIEKSKFNQVGAGISGAVAGASAGAGLGSFIGPIGTAIGGILGGITGGFGGMGVGAGIDANNYEKKRNKRTVAKLVPINSSEVSVDGSPGVPKVMFSLTKAGADAVVEKVMSGAKNKEFNMTNREFFERIQKAEERNKRINGVRGPLTSKSNLNEYKSSLANYEYRSDLYNKKFVDLNDNEYNQAYSNYNATMRNSGELFNSASGWVSTQIRAFTDFGSGGRKNVDEHEKRRRVNHCMKFFMDRGLTKAQAAGIVGNLASEGLFLKDLGEERPDNGGPSAGIAQFHDERGTRGQLSMLKEFARDNGLKWDDLDTQLEFLWSGYSSDANTALNNIKQLRGSDRDVAVASSKAWGMYYEKFKGHKPGTADYYSRGAADYSRRAGRSLGYLESYNAEDSGYTYQETKSRPLIDIQGITGGSVAVPESGVSNIIWIGDSQTCTCNSAFPEGVASGLGTHIAYFGAENATPSDFLKDNKIPGGVKTNVPALKGKSCKEALRYLTSKNASYCIIALGHYGVGNYQTLVNALNVSRLKVIGIKMWSTKDRNESEMSDLYKGISTDGWVDLSWLKVDKTQDGIRANSKGCKEAANETVYQLKTGTMSSWKYDPDDSESLLDKALDTIKGFFDGNGDKIKLANDLSPEQMAIMERMTTRSIDQENFNFKTYQYLGAKQDKKGTYIDFGGNYRAYLKINDNFNGLYGITKDNIDWIEEIGENGISREVPINDVENLKNSVVRKINTLYNSYSEKTEFGGYNDFMLNDKGKPIGFNIGTFSDIDRFDPDAQKDFSKFWIIKGITYIIYPSKDASDVTMISLPKAVPCSSRRVYDNRTKKSEMRYYGPVIYHKGARYEYYDGMNTKHCKGWQPICVRMNVRLTPEASKVVYETLLPLLRKLNDVQKRGNELVTKEGEVLTKEEKLLLQNLGIWDFNAGQFKEKGSSVVKSLKSASVDKGIVALGMVKDQFGATQKERQAYYEKHKDQFQISGHGLYETSSGVKFGAVDENGGVRIYTNEEFENEFKLTGQQGLEENKQYFNDKDAQALAKLGYVSRDYAADVLFKASNYDRGGKLKGRSEKAHRIWGSIGFRGINNRYTNLGYYVNHFSSGSKYYSSQTLGAILQKLGIETKRVSSSALNKRFEASSLNELRNVMTREISKYLRSSGETISADKGFSRVLEDLKDQTTKNLLNNGYLIRSYRQLNDGIAWVTDNGEVISKGLSFRDFKNIQEYIKQVNRQINLRQSQLQSQGTIEAYKGSKLERQHASLIAEANRTGKINQKNGYAVTDNGDIYGKVITGRDGKSRVVALTRGEDINMAALNPLNNDPAMRSATYREAFNLKNKTLGKTSGSFKEVGVNGKRYYVKMDTNVDLKEFQKKGYRALTGDNLEVYDERGNRIRENNKIVLQAIEKKMDSNVKFSGLTQKAIQQLLKVTQTGLKDSRRAEENKAKDRLKNQQDRRTMIDYLKIVAEKSDKEAVSDIEKQNKGEQRLLNQAIQLSRTQNKPLSNYRYVKDKSTGWNWLVDMSDFKDDNKASLRTASNKPHPSGYYIEKVENNNGAPIYYQVNNNGERTRVNLHTVQGTSQTSGDI